jgi:uncharacterized membrane protein
MKFDYFWDKKIGPIFIVNIQNKYYGLCLCHRNPEKSIPFFGLEKYLCARCLGLSFGGSLGLILNYLDISFPLIPATFLLVPMLIDGFSQAFRLRESNNILRLVTGFLFGLGIPTILNHILSFF